MAIRKIVSRSIGVDVIAAEDLANNSVTAAEISDGAVTVNKIGSGAVTTDKIGDAQVTAAKLAAGAAVPDQTGNSGKVLTSDGTDASWTTVENTLTSPSGRRNMVYNGAMEVSQRGTSFTATTSNIYSVDRFQWSVPGSGAEYAVTQETDAPDGFAKSVKIATTTTGGTDTLSYFRQRFEGQDTYHLAYGSSGAKSTTLSFWVKSNITGTFGVAVVQHSTTQRGSYHHYTITSANTWQKVTVNIPGDTGGASIWNQTMECSIDWFLSGDDTGSTPDGTWGARTSDQFMGTGTTELQSSTSNYWQITGVQWELGDVATPFEHRRYGEELALCQRYYQTASEASTSTGSNTHLAFQRYQNSGSYYVAPYQFPLEMRSGPTITLVNARAHLPGLAVEAIPSGNFTTYNSTNKGVMLRIETSTVNTGIYQVWIDRDNVSNRAYIEFDSEL
jgi:hypothetical protein